MAWEYTHCQNSKCKHYWEDSCTRSFDKKMTALDSEGKCMRFEKGESDYYRYQSAMSASLPVSEVDCSE